ncbi:MAG: hypothetical protein V4710_20155 [Verrucomicrobiota bacterium]
MAALFTLERLKKQIGYDQIAEERRSYTLQGGSIYYVRDFMIRPADSSLPFIYFVSDDEVTSLEQLGFSEWHGHFDSKPTEAARVRAAIKLTRQLISHDFCCVEELNGDGKCRGSSILRPTGIPDTLTKDIRQLRRMFFGQVAIIEPVDFSRYREDEHIFVERKT